MIDDSNNTSHCKAFVPTADGRLEEIILRQIYSAMEAGKQMLLGKKVKPYLSFKRSYSDNIFYLEDDLLIHEYKDRDGNIVKEHAHKYHEMFFPTHEYWEVVDGSN